MKSLGMRAVVIAIFLLAITFFAASFAKASGTTLEKPNFAIAAQIAPTYSSGYDKHAEALKRIYLGMDLARVSEIFGVLFDPRTDFMRIEVDEKNPESVRLFWRWNNSFIDKDGLVEEASAITVFVECHKVTIISFDYIRSDRDSITKDSRLKGVRVPEKK